MADDVINELLNRVAKLEAQVTQLESLIKGTVPNLVSNAKEFTPSVTNQGGTTRKRAVDSLNKLLPTGYRVIGYRNKATKGVSIVGLDGSRTPIYFTSSGKVDGWQTILKDEVTSGKYESYVLAFEDVDGTFVHFVFTESELLNLVKEQVPSESSVYHFYISKINGVWYYKPHKNQGTASIDITQYKYTGTQLGY